jgi:hypothetical protein
LPADLWDRIPRGEAAPTDALVEDILAAALTEEMQRPLLGARARRREAPAPAD